MCPSAIQPRYHKGKLWYDTLAVIGSFVVPLTMLPCAYISVSGSCAKADPTISVSTKNVAIVFITITW